MRFRLTWRGAWVFPRPGEGRLLRWRWLGLPLLTLGVFVLALLLAQGRESRIAFEVMLAGLKPGADPRLRALSMRLFEQRQGTAAESVFGRSPAPVNELLPEVRLFLSTNSLEEMLRQPERGAPRDCYPAYLELSSGSQIRCDVTGRGLSEWHRTAAKPSLRVRIPRPSIRDGRRFVELQRPEDALALRNWLPEELGRQGGLLTCLSRHVRLVLNNRPLGVYLDTFRPDDLLAIRQGRLPGVFFKGDSPRAEDSLWEQERLWKAFGEVTEEDWEVLGDLMELARELPHSTAMLTRLDRDLDLEAYARWCALAVLTGTAHTDDHHNQVFYLSSYRGKLEPVVWDLNGYGIHLPASAPVNLVLNRVQYLAYQDPRFLHRRNQLLFEWNRGMASPQAVRERVDPVLARILPDLAADPALGDVTALVPPGQLWAGMPGVLRGLMFFESRSPAQLEALRRAFYAWVEVRHSQVEEFLADARVSLRASSTGSVVTVFGNCAVEVHSSPDLRDPAGGPLLLYPGIARELALERELYYTPVQVARPAPLAYALGLPPQRLSFRNAVTGEAVQPVELPAGLPETLSIHPWTLPAPVRGETVLGPGPVELRHDLVLGPGQVLRIRPGTELRLAAGAGIYSRGRVLAEGTEAAPISIRPLEAQPFACLGLAGPGTAGTRFAYLSVRGGSLGRLEGIRFKGMVSVYDCPDLEIRHSEFGQNVLSDDAVNLGDSRVLVEDSRWVGAASDGLDCDQVRGRVRNCQFLDSGNDGLDLSQSQVEVEGCRFEANQDKGISVGEGTRVVARDCDFLRCNIGIQSKDGSRAEAIRCRFADNGVGVDAYRKKWLFGVGGTAVVRDCSLVGPVGVRLDALSRIVLQRTEVPLPGQNRDGVYLLP